MLFEQSTVLISFMSFCLDDPYDMGLSVQVKIEVSICRRYEKDTLLCSDNSIQQ